MDLLETAKDQSFNHHKIDILWKWNKNTKVAYNSHDKYKKSCIIFLLQAPLSGDTNKSCKVAIFDKKNDQK